jgi:hypothetical protein
VKLCRLSVNIFLKTENEPSMSTEVIGAYLKQVVCRYDNRLTQQERLSYTSLSIIYFITKYIYKLLFNDYEIYFYFSTRQNTIL